MQQQACLQKRLKLIGRQFGIPDIRERRKEHREVGELKPADGVPVMGKPVHVRGLPQFTAKLQGPDPRNSEGPQAIQRRSPGAQRRRPAHIAFLEPPLRMVKDSLHQARPAAEAAEYCSLSHTRAPGKVVHRQRFGSALGNDVQRRGKQQPPVSGGVETLASGLSGFWPNVLHGRQSNPHGNINGPGSVYSLRCNICAVSGTVPDRSSLEH